jgi:hypothetical protein
LSEQELNGIEIVRDADQMIALIPIKLTEAKLQILLTVVKAQGIDLAQVIEDSVDQDFRCQLESSTDIGGALNKRMCVMWLQKIEVPDNQGE